MKLKIVQPEVEKKDEDVIELWLEYDPQTAEEVRLFSRKHGKKCVEATINTEGGIEIVAFDIDKNRTYRLCNPTNLKNLIIFP